MLSKGWPRFFSSLGSGGRVPQPFFAILQNAAGRAWARRADGNLRHYSTAALHNAANTGDEKIAGPSTRTKAAAPRLHHLHLDCITEEDVKFSDPGRCGESFDCWDDEQLGTPVARFISKRPRTLPPVTSRNILYRNLIQLSRRVPPVALPKLMDYHDMYPKTQSTRSYNLLISLAIRTASLGSAQSLFQGMAAANMNRNLETHKLYIRWQIRIGAWDAAWQTLSSAAVLSDGNDIPDFLWIEFFGSLKRRSVRRKGVVLEEADDPFVLYAQRFLHLMQNRPSFSLTHARPRVIHCIAYVLLQLQRQKEAHRLVQTYFNHLPAHLAPETTLYCLDIIHILIVFGSRAKGEKKFHEHRAILDTLLATHTSFKPTPTTLYLLLGSLRGAMRCGALASKWLAMLKHKWGPDVEDHRVRLRVASLALKQGRLSTSSKMLSTRELDSSGDEVGLERSSRRPRFKSIFRGTGKLRALEIRLKIRMMKAKRRKRYRIKN